MAQQPPALLPLTNIAQAQFEINTVDNDAPIGTDCQEICPATKNFLTDLLARFTADPKLQADDLGAAGRRLGVLRQAQLEEHPEAARRILAREAG